MREKATVKGHVVASVRRFLGVDSMTGEPRYGEWKVEAETDNLVCTDGIDFLFAQGYSTSPGANGANYIALTTDGTAANAADTTLASEITTNGLERAQGTYAHTNDASTATISKTFTASGTHTGVQKSGLFTASSGGVMVHEAVFSPSVNLASGDQLAITWTITLS